MASYFFGANIGAQNVTDVTAQATTPSKDVEVQIVYTATNASKRDVLTALDAIKTKIIQTGFPPA